MSDHEEENDMETGYDTPVPELDDHRNRLPTTQRTERPRRGTFDSLYGHQADHGARLSSDHQAGIRVRDFEEAVDDGDAPEDSHEGLGPRRLTAGTVRTISPPNSVKAFAEARRRERDMSFSEQKPEKDSDVDHLHLHRAASVASRRSLRSLRSLRSRPRTVDDASSMSSNKSAEEDVCFPVSEEHRRDQLRIDYAYLESFMEEEREEREEARRSSEARTFPDLRPQISATESTAPTPMITSDGDFVGTPASLPKIEDEKAQAPAIAEPKLPAKPVQHIDPNRFSFFSSAWESTIHAAEFSDLVLPGESVRGLFTFPEGETDGVWWLNINRPTEEEARAICRAFGIHPLTSEDITQQETREKIEIFPSYYFASFRSFNIVKDEDGEVDYEPFHTYVVVFREGTLSFSFAPNSHASKVRTRIALLKDYVALSSDWICYALM